MWSLSCIMQGDTANRLESVFEGHFVCYRVSMFVLMPTIFCTQCACDLSIMLDHVLSQITTTAASANAMSSCWATATDTFSILEGSSLLILQTVSAGLSIIVRYISCWHCLLALRWPLHHLHKVILVAIYCWQTFAVLPIQLAWNGCKECITARHLRHLPPFPSPPFLHCDKIGICVTGNAILVLLRRQRYV